LEGGLRLVVIEMEDFSLSLSLFRALFGDAVTFPYVRTHTSREMCAGIVILYYSYNKSQQDALFLNFILVKNSTFFGHHHQES